MFTVLLPLAVVAIVVFAVRNSRRSPSSLSTGQQARSFFQYAILLAAVLVASAGVAGTIGTVIDGATFVAADANDTALNLAMLLLGVPLTAILGVTTRRHLSGDRSDLQSFGWSLFITIGTVAPLVVAMFGAYQVLLFVFGVERYDGYALSQLLTWTGTWYAVRRVDRATGRTPRTTLRHVVPALIGLTVAAVALGQLVAGLAQRIFDASSAAVIVPTTTMLHRGLALLVVGAVVWVIEWLRGVSSESGSEAWRFVVVLFGVTGGLVTAIVSLATAAYQIAVWLIGSPASEIARTHFETFPEAIGGVVVGVLAWWYHRSLLATHRTESRTEIDRVYEYIMSAGGLLAAAVGAVILLVAVVEAVTGTRLIRGDTAINTLLLSIILLAIGIPVWSLYWRTTLHRTGIEDRGSVSRRVYLITLLGVGGLVALGTAIATVYLFLRDLIEGRLASSTLRSLRYPLAMLLTSGAVAGYHFTVFRAEHVGGTGPRRRRRIVIAGPANAALDSALRLLPDLDIDWTTTNDGVWPVDDVIAQIKDSRDDLVIVLTRNGPTIARL
ncbi:MAG: DUF5671 domain-containing protein [Ilumatobacteraceae bacterium]